MFWECFFVILDLSWAVGQEMSRCRVGKESQAATVRGPTGDLLALAIRIRSDAACNNKMLATQICFFIPILGKMIQCDEHMFQMGWFNYQLDDGKPSAIH